MKGRGVFMQVNYTKYDFDRIVDRTHTNDLKWNREAVIGHLKNEVPEDFIPMWIADTEFACAPMIVEAIKKRADKEIFGYCAPGSSFRHAVAYWQKQRFGWEIQTNWIVPLPTVVAGINVAIRTFSQEGDGVIIQQPVYDPFAKIIKDTGRTVVNNGLLLKSGRYVMNLEELEALAANPHSTMMILCSPHNPIGRVWTREELQAVADICHRNHVMLVSDEIHSDIVFDGHRHYPILSLEEAHNWNFIHLTSPGKTFNVAGLKSAMAIIPNEASRAAYEKTQVSMSLDIRNTFGLECVEAAYTPEGIVWLEQELAYMEKNVDMTEQFVRESMPGVTMVRPEGTFLCWLDLSALHMEDDKLLQKIIYQARVICVPGTWFGEGGSCHLRLNIGCPSSLLKEALERIKEALGI